jgi:transposase
MVEGFFQKLKQCRRIATRDEKSAQSFSGMVHFGALINLLQ